MNKKQLLSRLSQIRRDFHDDTEAMHSKADNALIEFIGDKSIERSYGRIDKWYA